MTLIRAVARPLLASMFVVGGFNSLKNAPALAPAAQPVTDKVVPMLRKVVPSAPIPEDTTTLVRINGAVQLVGGAMLATGRLPRFSSLVLAGSLTPTTVAGHAFWTEGDPEVRQQQRVHFLKNLSMIGGLMMASVDADPHKKMLVRRAADSVGEAAEQAREATTRAARRADKRTRKSAKRASRTTDRATRGARRRVRALAS